MATGSSDANGEKMGSKECEEGKIFIEPQGFAIMSEIGKDQGCDMKTLAAIDERLNTKHGLVLNNPAYTKYYIQYGEISTYPGGYKENAGIFTHNNAWIICAAAYAGQRLLLLSPRRHLISTRLSHMYMDR